MIDSPSLPRALLVAKMPRYAVAIYVIRLFVVFLRQYEIGGYMISVKISGHLVGVWASENHDLG